MIAFIIAPFFIALLIFVFVRILKHISSYSSGIVKICEYIIGIVLFSGFIIIVVGFFLSSNIEAKRIITKIGYGWLGLILYFLVSLLIAIIIRAAAYLIFKNKGYSKKIARNITIVFVIVFTLFMNIYGHYNAHLLRITNYDINVNKKSNIDELNVVLISDLHLGYNVGIDEIRDMANKINELNPDLVILAGDIFDNEYDAIENPKELIGILNSINAKYGKYAVYGNHDIEEKILVGFTFNYSNELKQNARADERMNDFIKDAGFKLLYDSYELINDSVYVYGRPDAIKYNLGNSRRVDAKDITKDLDKNKTIICIDHQPGELNELSNAGVDIDLSGHTHNGQIWPGTLTINLFWDNAYGLKKIGNMYSIVSSGVGLFGVDLRTGCFPEIVNIKISF